jgi:transposase-like protein
MTLLEYADALEKSRKPGDVVVARYIRTHEARLFGWIRQFTNGMNRADRDELLQVAVLACVEAVRAPDAETAITSVRNAMDRHAHQAQQWKLRRIDKEAEEN